LNTILEEKFVMSRYYLSKRIYGLLQQSCIENEQNQEYLLAFLDVFSQHITSGKFVIEFLESIFHNNYKILKKLPQMTFNKRGDFGQNENFSFLKMLFCKAKEKESQQKDLLDFLNKLCFNGFYNRISRYF